LKAKSHGTLLKYPLSDGAAALSLIIKKPRIPMTVTIAPMTVNIIVQLCDLFKSKNINPPNTRSIDTKGIIEFIPSAAPLFVESVESVSHALNAASFAAEPKNVITQSSRMVSVTPSDVTETAMGNNVPNVCVFNATKLNIETPQRMYPIHINTLRLPNLSDNAPMNTVVNVAAMELAVTIAEMSAADALNIL